MPQLSYGKGEWIWSNLNLKAIKTSYNLNFLLHKLSVDLVCTPSQDNTGKTYQNIFMSNKQFQLKKYEDDIK